MPLIGGGQDAHSASLALALTQRFDWCDGLFHDQQWSGQPHWLVALSAFERWFDLLEEELQSTLGRRLAHAAADSEEMRSAVYPRPKQFFGKHDASKQLVNSDWALRGVGQLRAPKPARSASEIDVEIHGRLSSCLSAGMANAAWEWIVQRRHRFRWEDRGSEIAMVHLDRLDDEIAAPSESVSNWPTEQSEGQRDKAEHPLSMPFELIQGCWEISGERHILLPLDMIIRFSEMTAIYSENAPEPRQNCDWSCFDISPNLAKVWSAAARALQRTFIESGDLFMVAEAVHWVAATIEPLSEHGLGKVSGASDVDANGGVELVVERLFHPALVTGLLQACWARANGRDAAAVWRCGESGELILRLDSVHTIADF